ncbi:accessory protein [denwin virus]|uniref:Accessory protein n=1 Tax=denwin virus TaxID=2940993 RepID=A0AAE9HWH9_9MONO|nr:accessory protein [denwin virus]
MANLSPVGDTTQDLNKQQTILEKPIIRNKRKQSHPSKLSIDINTDSKIDKIEQPEPKRGKKWFFRGLNKSSIKSSLSADSTTLERPAKSQSCPTKTESNKSKMGYRLSNWSMRLGLTTNPNQHTEEVPSVYHQQKTEPVLGNFSTKLRLMPMDMKRGLIKKEMTQLKEEMSEGSNMIMMILLAEEKDLLRRPTGMNQTTSYLKTHWLQTFTKMIQEENLPTGSLITRMMSANVITHIEAYRAMEVLKMIRLVCPAYSRVVYLQTEMLKDLIIRPNTR